MSIRNKYVKIIKYHVEMTTSEPMHIGSADGNKEEILVYPVSGMPFIQASGIAGVMRQYFKQIDNKNGRNEEFINELFGDSNYEENDNSSEKGSRLIITDGIFKKDTIKIELRPRVSIDKKTGSCASSVVQGTNINSGNKFNVEYIGAGAAVEFDVYLFDENKQKDFEQIFFDMDKLQFGGQKSNGCGFVKVSKLLKKEFDMTDVKQRKQWANEEDDNKIVYEEVKNISKSVTTMNLNVAYQIVLKGRTENVLLIKSLSMSEDDKGRRYSENIRNASDDYIIPGSSMKGVIKSQMERIATILEKSGYDTKDIITNTFGSAGSEEENGNIGNICFFDTIVGKKQDNDSRELSHRIHIDKFTGGVMHKGLFSDKNVSGDVKFTICIHDRNNPEKSLALLVMALRDLAAGMISVGGGFNVGKGFIHVSTIEIKAKAGKTVIDFEKNEIKDEKDIIKGCFDSIHKKERVISEKDSE